MVGYNPRDKANKPGIAIMIAVKPPKKGKKIKKNLWEDIQDLKIIEEMGQRSRKDETTTNPKTKPDPIGEVAQAKEKARRGALEETGVPSEPLRVDDFAVDGGFDPKLMQTLPWWMQDPNIKNASDDFMKAAWDVILRKTDRIPDTPGDTPHNTGPYGEKIPKRHRAKHADPARRYNPLIGHRIPDHMDARNVQAVNELFNTLPKRMQESIRRNRELKNRQNAHIDAWEAQDAADYGEYLMDIEEPPLNLDGEILDSKEYPEFLSNMNLMRYWRQFGTKDTTWPSSRSKWPSIGIIDPQVVAERIRRKVNPRWMSDPVQSAKMHFESLAEEYDAKDAQDEEMARLRGEMGMGGESGGFSLDEQSAGMQGLRDMEEDTSQTGQHGGMSSKTGSMAAQHGLSNAEYKDWQRRLNVRMNEGELRRNLGFLGSDYKTASEPMELAWRLLKGESEAEEMMARYGTSTPQDLPGWGEEEDYEYDPNYCNMEHVGDEYGNWYKCGTPLTDEHFDRFGVHEDDRSEGHCGHCMGYEEPWDELHPHFFEGMDEDEYADYYKENDGKCAVTGMKLNEP